MDDYAKEMMNLKTLVTRTLEKKGILARIRAIEEEDQVLEAIEEEDQVLRNNDNIPPALLGSCNDRAKQLHASPSDRQLGSAVPANGKDEYNWRYDSGDLSEDIIRASTGLENIQLDKETRNLTTSWRHAGDDMMEGDGKVDHR